MGLYNPTILPLALLAFVFSINLFLHFVLKTCSYFFEKLNVSCTLIHPGTIALVCRKEAIQTNNSSNENIGAIAASHHNRRIFALIYPMFQLVLRSPCMGTVPIVVHIKLADYHTIARAVTGRIQLVLYS
jgi:hypothetical protein